MNDNDLHYETRPTGHDLVRLQVMVDSYTVPQVLELLVDICATRAEEAKEAGCTTRAAVWNRYVNRIEAAITTIAA